MSKKISSSISRAAWAATLPTRWAPASTARTAATSCRSASACGEAFEPPAHLPGVPAERITCSPAAPGAARNHHHQGLTDGDHHLLLIPE
jgi:hypothetical protein